MVKIQKQEEAKCKQETKQTFLTPGDGSSLSCGHGMMIFTRVPANHIKTSKCIKIYQNGQRNIFRGTKIEVYGGFRLCKLGLIL